MHADELVHHVLKQIGGNGRFQKLAFIIFCMCTASIGFVVYDLGYLELMPAFTCNNIGQTTTFDCKPDGVNGFCNQPDIEYTINYNNSTSLHNWVEKLSLVCRPGWQIGLLGSALFAGWSATLLWVPPLADKYGRRKLFVWGVVANLVLYTIVMASHSYWLTVGCIFLIGALESIRISIGYTYVMELMYEPDRSFYGTVWNVNEGLIYLWATIYFGLIAKAWFPFVSIGYMLSVISTIGVFFYPESPCYLVKKGLYAEASKSF